MKEEQGALDHPFNRHFSVGRPIAASLAISLDGIFPKYASEFEESLPGWSFVVGEAGSAREKEKFRGFYGWIGSGWCESPPASAVRLADRVPEEALFAFLLTCGLSAVEAANLEIGDLAVISGGGSLAQSIRAAAILQGARCISFGTAGEEGELFACTEKQVYSTATRPEEIRAANPLSQRFVIWETTGEPEMIDVLFPQLGPRGKLVVCRRDKSCAAQLDCYRDLHKRSAVIESWHPASEAQLPSMGDCYARASRLIQYGRVSKGSAWRASR